MLSERTRALTKRIEAIKQGTLPNHDRLLCKCGAVATHDVPGRGWRCVECWMVWVEREQQRVESR